MGHSGAEPFHTIPEFGQVVIHQGNFALRIRSLAVTRNPVPGVFAEQLEPFLVTSVIEEASLTIQEVFGLGAAQVWHRTRSSANSSGGGRNPQFREVLLMLSRAQHQRPPPAIECALRRLIGNVPNDDSVRVFI